MTKRIATIVLVALMGAGLNAQTVDLTQKSLEDLMNIDVTSVSRKEQKVSQTAAAVFVITRDDIRHSGAQTLPDLLRMVPGMDVAQDSPSSWAISARGFNLQYSNKLLVMVDGRTVYNPIFAGVYWDSQNIPLNSIERIEVIRGPGAAVWGSNAVNGVINIITRKSDDNQGGYLAAGGSNTGTGPETVGFGGKADHLDAYRVYAEGFHYGSQPTFSGQNWQNDWRLIHGGFRTDTKLSASDSLTVEGEGYAGNEGEQVTVPISLAPPVTETLAPRERYSGWNVLGRWDRVSSAQASTSIQIYFDRITRDDDTTIGAGMNTVDIAFQNRRPWGARQDIVWGLGYRAVLDHTAPTFAFSFNPQNRLTQLFSAFAQDEISLLPNRLSIILGAREEHNDYTGFDVEPSLRMVWTPIEGNAFWAAVSKADRIPSRIDTAIRVNFSALPGPGGLPELVSLFANPAQKNEGLNAFEAGYRSTVSSRLSLDLSAFYNRYRDLESEDSGTPTLETSPLPPHLLIPLMFGNGNYGEAHGAELFAKWKATSFWTLSPGYAFFTMHTHPFAGNNDETLIAAFNGGTPDHQAQLRSSMSLPWHLEWNTAAYFVDRLPAQSVPSYTRVDTGLIWQAGERVSFSAYGQNLLREAHPEYNGVDLIGPPSVVSRNAYARVEWSF